MHVRVQSDDFDTSAEVARLIKGRSDVGAVVIFKGLVRDDNPADPLRSLVLERYPEMTRRTIEEIADEAEQRWPILDGIIIHRYGELETGQNIVLVAVVAQHRHDAFKAANFLIDWLKTKAPFWKKEIRDSGEHWIEAKTTDETAANLWTGDSGND